MQIFLNDSCSNYVSLNVLARYPATDSKHPGEVGPMTC